MAPYKRKSDRMTFTSRMMEEAKRRLEARESKRKVANDLGINECTLKKNLRLAWFRLHVGDLIVLTDEMERELAQHCKDLNSMFYGLTRKHMVKVAFEYADVNGVAGIFNNVRKSDGKDWLKSFCNRHNLSVRNPEKCSVARAMGFNEVQVTRFYNNLKSCCLEKKLSALRKFNMDETGISTVPNRTPMVITPKGKKTVCKISSTERGQTVTVVCCMSATGVFVPPALILSRKRMNPLLYKDAPNGSFPLISDTGYMNSHLFIDRLRHFVKHTKRSAEDPVLLIADKSHIPLLTTCSLVLSRESYNVSYSD
ncbi:hypothetical protein AVEN_70907-1 [Araneus ventricosus]|uniref:DDE-1 domain-containing protein n=1 Tax=Araneus ventricosus TaxID=182803 RepID=A0A4Y2TU08_ARAVE|nr:hypothetical protein AVEN_70907-1 [Araneus ventricosus]